MPTDAETFPAAVHRHAASRPETIAIDRPQGPVTYGALAAAADEVADRLRAVPVHPGELVVVHGEVSAATIAAALGVMTVGAAVVPLDNGDPPTRVASVLDDCAARLVLSTGQVPFPATPRPVTVLPLRDPVETHRAVPVPGELPAGAGDLAYALFTSGSTGRPKGVLIEHGNLMNYLRHVADATRVDGAVPVLPALTPMSFDASVQQVYAPLARGEQVWLLPAGTRHDPGALIACLADRQGAGLHCVPSLWEEVLRELVARPDLAARLELAALFLGGEVVRPDLWETTRKVLPRTRLANVYGPTEATVQATGGFQEPGAPLTTGRPIAGARISIRDEQGRPVPTGVRGEVYIAGAGVGRGYLNRPELTAERFLADPDVPGGRMFRTGDAGVLAGDGTLTVSGRLDDQMKVRGFRIEPGDVEAALCAHPAVARCAAAVQEPGSSLARLVVAVVPAGPPLDVEDLRRHAAETLPGYLVPTLIRAVDALPHAANGKLDRLAVAAFFPAPEPVGGADTGTGGAAAGRAGTLADRLRPVWAALLGTERIAADDDFFEIGGHSLLATRLIGRVRRELGQPVPLRTIFDHRTFADFAAAVGRLAGGDDGPTPAAGTDHPRRVPDDQPVPLSWEQRPLWAAEQIAPGLATAHVILPLQLDGAVELDQVRAALTALVRRHEALRTVVVLDGDRATLRVRDTATVPIEPHDLRGVAAAEQQRQGRALALRAYRVPFDLTTDLPVRATWIRLAEDRSILLLTLHHIACDGVSLRIISADVEAALRGSLPPPAGLRYRDYAAWQDLRWRGGGFRADLDYWLRELGAGRKPVAWPRPLPPLQERTYRHAITGVDVPVELAEALGSVAAVHTTTPFVVLSAALAAVIVGWTGAPEVAVGVMTANRTRPEFESTVGLFATTVVLRVPVPGTTSFAGLLRAVHETALRAQTHQELPLEVVVEQLRARGVDAPPFDLGLSVDWDDLAPAGAGQNPGPTVSAVTPETDDIPTGVMAGSTPLTVFASRSRTSVRFTAEYSLDQFDEESVRALLEALVALLHRVVVDPSTQLDG